MNLLLGLLAIVSWVGGALLAEARIITPFLFLLISALGWFFLVTAIGGKKGAVVGIGMLVLVVCAVGLLIKMPQMPKDFLPYEELKPGSFFFWFGVLAAAGLTLLLPSIVIVKIWKRSGKEQKKDTKEEKKEKKKKEKKVRKYKTVRTEKGGN